MHPVCGSTRKIVLVLHFDVDAVVDAIVEVVVVEKQVVVAIVIIA